jgi:hypothetical protein
MIEDAVKFLPVKIIPIKYITAISWYSKLYFSDLGIIPDVTKICNCEERCDT